MLLKKLELYCFRNYTYLSFAPSSQTLIVGNNGHGKTNLLEALFLLAYGRSFRPHLPESLVQDKKDVARISAHIEKGSKKSLLQLSITKAGKKQIWINEKKSVGFRVSREFPLIIFSPESLVLLKGSAEHRRYWLDSCLSMQGKGKVVREFKKALAQRNGLLKQVQKGLVLEQRVRPLFESLNELFIEKNMNLMEERRKFLLGLNVFLKESGNFVFQSIKRPFLKEILSVETRYLGKGQDGEENIENLFRKKVEENYFLEQKAGVSLYGAHRDDFKMFFQGKDSRYFCSQGQQRGLLLALKMAQILWFHHVQKTSCLLLLDDVFSEIDKHMVLNLLDFLNEIPSQTILTSVKTPSFLNRKKFQVFNLYKGVLRKGTLSERRTQAFGELSSF